jgi:hypothetical protein
LRSFRDSRVITDAHGCSGPETKDNKTEKKNKVDGKEKETQEKIESTEGDRNGEDVRDKVQTQGKEIAGIAAKEAIPDKIGKKEEKEKKKEPAREKVKINPRSLALLGQPLGTIFPFLESDELKRLPIENLEFTYCEESSGHFSPPGLRLEADVPLKDSLQWAKEALHKMFGDERTPEKIHLSAELGKKRDWSKRPKVEDFVLRGYFTGFKYQEWDMLQFQTLGLELTATKAASKKPKDDKAGKDKEKPKDISDDGKEEKLSPNATGKNSATEPKETNKDGPVIEQAPASLDTINTAEKQVSRLFTQPPV